MSGDFQTWYQSVPQISRYWFTGAAVIPLLGRIGILSTWWMALEWTLLFHNWHIWRPLTALFFFPITPQTGFHWMLMLYFLYNYSTRLETGTFDRAPADYLFCLIFCWIASCIICLFTEVYFLLDPMVMAVLYIWCALNRDTIVSFWFGTQFKAMYLPWILLAFNMVLRGGGLNEVIGIIVGHSYFFLMFKYPQDFGGAVLLKTPQFLYNMFPSNAANVYGFGSTPTGRAEINPNADRPNQPRQHQWGRGVQLGE